MPVKKKQLEPDMEQQTGSKLGKEYIMRTSQEEIPLVQGKEQWLRFPGAAVKRYPTSKVRETQVRQ